MFPFLLFVFFFFGELGCLNFETDLKMTAIWDLKEEKLMLLKDLQRMRYKGTETKTNVDLK